MPGAGHDAERLAAAGPLPEFLAVLALQHGLEAEAEGDLDGFAGGASGRDDDDPAPGVRGVPVGLGIGREEVVAGGNHDWVRKARAS